MVVAGGGKERYGVYTSPSIKYSELDIYAKPTLWRGHKIRVVLQCRQNLKIEPPALRIIGETIGWHRRFGDAAISPHFPNDKIERCTESMNSVIPCRILVGMDVVTREEEEKTRKEEAEKERKKKEEEERRRKEEVEKEKKKQEEERQRKRKEEEERKRKSEEERKQGEEKRRQKAPSSSSSRCSVLNCSRTAWNGADGEPCCRTCCRTDGKKHGPDCEQRHHEEQLLAGGDAPLQQTMCLRVEDTYARKNLFNRACKHCNKLKGEHFAEDHAPAFRFSKCKQESTTVYYCKAPDERSTTQAVQSMIKRRKEKEEEERKHKENEEKERVRKEKEEEARKERQRKVTKGRAMQVDLMRGPTGGVGIGISRAQLPQCVWPVASEPGPLVVCSLVSGGTAEQCGQIREGDLLHSINGVSVSNMSLEQAKPLILGQPGTLLSLNLYSPSSQERSQILTNVGGAPAASRMSVAPESKPAQQQQQQQQQQQPPVTVVELTRGPTGGVGVDLARWVRCMRSRVMVEMILTQQGCDKG